MSDFGSKFTAAGIVKLLDRLGDTVTYTPVGGVGVSRQAVFVLEGANTENAFGTFTMATDATTGIASPARGDTITLGADVWRVVEARTADLDGASELRCVLPLLTN